MKKYRDLKGLFFAVMTPLLLYVLGYEKFYDFDANIASGLILAGHISLAALFLTFSWFLIENRSRARLAVHCFFLGLCKKSIRFSMSYLYLIEVDGKYLLVKSSNFDHYQLVGGKYKVYDIGKQHLEDLEARSDYIMKDHGVAKDDLALFVPAKNALNFLDWFETGANREISHWREFYEELLSQNNPVLSHEHFKYVDYRLEKTVMTPIRTTPWWDGCPEILRYDILRLIPSPQQEMELRQLLNKGDTDYIKWVDQQLIDTLGRNIYSKEVEFKIGEHTKWALNGKFSKN